MPKPHQILWLLPVLVTGAFSSASQADIDNRIQIEARGPVHEAFAQPWVINPEQNEIVTQESPAPIAEEPPSDRPAGTNVQWLPGYWQWDDERKDFVWVSGFWRDVPDGRRWVMGYWSQTGDGWRWIGGHWAGEQEADEQLVPQPPANLDEGPTTPAPDADSFYIPGSWFYTSVGYRWRPGYWADCRPGFLWVPARYWWTPRGWGFCSGYWDYALAARGLLFAPVYFTSAVYLTPGFMYRPVFVVGFNSFYSSLFVRIGFGHYYFGDYYGHGYVARGFQPWHSFGARHHDPLFTYERWARRGNPNWFASLSATHQGRVNGTLAVPPRTLAAQSQLALNSRTPAMLQSLNQVRQSGVRMETLSTQQRNAIAQQTQQMNKRSAQIRQPTTNRVPSGLSPSPGGSSRAAISSGPSTPSKPPVTDTPRGSPTFSSAPTTPARRPVTSAPRGNPAFSRRPAAPPSIGAARNSPTFSSGPTTSFKPPAAATTRSNPTFTEPPRPTPRFSQPSFGRAPSNGNGGNSRHSFAGSHSGAGSTFHGSSGFHSNGSGHSNGAGSSHGSGAGHNGSNHGNHR
jgi:hypothetical protein